MSLKEINKYEFTKNPPQPLNTAEYINKSSLEFESLLENRGNDENAFQEFFEKNPIFVPGLDKIGPIEESGPNPFNFCLISQPKISGINFRKPDFLWLDSNSLVFSPLFIEIEAPNKKYFNSDRSRTPTANFKNAKNQLDEWSTLLSIPENILKFYSDYDISKREQDKIFEPKYILVYGRRSEYETDKWLTQKRYNLLNRNNHQYLMSYDRIKPKVINNNFICATVAGGKYYAKYLSPNYKLNIYHNYLNKIVNLDEAINNMAYTSKERKEFLQLKYPILIDYLNNEGNNSPRLLDYNSQYEE